MAERMNLTARAAAAIEPTAKDRIVWDDRLAGFGLRVFPSGTRKWVIQYRNADGQTRRLGLGPFPKMSAEAARKAAMAHFGAIVQGADPSGQHQAQRASLTVAAVCDRYMKACDDGVIVTRRGKPKKELTIYTDRGRIERHIKPLIGTLKANSVKAKDIEKLKAGIVTGKTAADIRTGIRGRAIVRGGRGAATRALGLLGAIFQWAIGQGYMESNPVRGVQRYKDQRRAALLAPEQYRALGMALDTLAAERTRNGHAVHHPYGLAAIRFIALTGLRRGEALGLRWDEVDVAGRCVRLKDSKTGESVRPLGAPALALLEGLERISQHVFPTGPRGAGYQGVPKLWGKVKAAANPEGDDDGPLDSIQLHGLRHSFAGWANKEGNTLPTIAAMIGHKLGGVTPGYVLVNLDAALIAATDSVSSRIAEMMDAGD